MKNNFKNKLGMTLIEVLLAVTIFVLMIWVFAPFVASTFKQIAQAGNLHVELSEDVSAIDGWIADEFFGSPATFPVKVGTDSNIDVSGIYLSSGQLHTFFSNVTSYISTDDILYEGYGSDGFYDAYYSIGFLPEITDKKFFKNDHTYVVTLTGKDGFEYLVDEEFDVLHSDPKNDIDPDSIEDGASVFIVASQFPDGVGGNPDKIGYILIIPDTLGLDNSNSPYELMIKTKDTGQNFIEEPVLIDVMLPLYQAVGEDGFERIASFIDYWVDKFNYSNPNYGDDGITVIRLPSDVDFNDVIWYEDDTIGMYITVGNNGNLWYRAHEFDWIEVTLNIGSSDLNRIKRLGNMFVAIGSGGAVITSNDLTISADPPPQAENPTDSMSWGNNFITNEGADEKDLTAFSYNSASGYVIAASDGTIYTSTNLVTYQSNDTLSALLTENQTINDMEWTGNYFLAVGNDNLIAVSTTGNGWTILDPAATINSPDAFDNFNCVFIYKSIGFILGQTGQIHTFSMTPDVSGWTWTTVRSHNVDSEDLYDMTYSRRAFVVVGEDGVVMYSLNGSTWTDCTKMAGFNLEKDIYAVAGRE